MGNNASTSVAAGFQDMIDVLKKINNRCHGKAGLAEGTTAATIKTANDVIFSIDGKAYQKLATDNITMSAAIQGANKVCKFLVSVAASGTVTITKGSDAASSSLASLPAIPASSAPLGYFEVDTATSGTYTCGTTDLSGAGIDSVVYQDLSSVVDV